MVTFFILIGFSQIFFNFSILEIAQDLSTPFHQKCLSWIPITESGSEIRRALICGKNIDDVELARQLTQIGLIHLVVVSGTHLEFLSRGLQFLKVPERWITLFLGVFLLVSHFQPPVVRSFIDSLVSKKVRHNSLIWSSLACLCLFPEWLSSLSFWMSLSAATIIRLPGLLLDQKKPLSELKNQALIYILFLPITCFLTPTAPFAILTNLIFASWLGVLWIPLALFPQSEFLFEFLLQHLPDTNSSSLNTGAAYWIFLTFLMIYSILLIMFMTKRQHQYRCSWLYS